MRILLDANLSPSLVGQLEEAGYSALHVAKLDMLAASDDAILDRAAAQRWVLVTADSDFAMLLAVRRDAMPSVVLLRHVNELKPIEQGALLIANLPAVIDDLELGALISRGWSSPCQRVPRLYESPALRVH